ncbi:hypothetical protein ACET3Z_007963 [Daucus carota]
MARKAQAVDILPPPSSSDDETQDQDGSSSSTDDEQPQNPPQPQKPQESEESDDSDDETEDDEPEAAPQPVVKKPSLREAPEESDDSDSGTESDETQNSPSASAFTVKPVVQKAVAKSPEPKTPSSKAPRVKSRAKRPTESEETDKVSKAVSKNQEIGKGKGGSSKRPAEAEAEKIDKVSKSKKSKVTNGDGQSVGKVDKGSKGKKAVSGDEDGGEVEEKKSIAKWHWKDEIALLGGIVDFKAETGGDWNSKLDVFYESVKDLLSVKLTKNQLSEKVKRLKKKFQTNVGKFQNGEEPVFSKPHESKLFELSQKIWGSEGTGADGNDSKVKSTKKKGKDDGIVVGNANTSTPVKSNANRELFVQEEVKNTIVEDRREETQDVWSLYPNLCASVESEVSSFSILQGKNLKDHVKKIISGMGEEKARELEDEWEAIHGMDLQLYARRTQLISKQAGAIANVSNI